MIERGQFVGDDIDGIAWEQIYPAPALKGGEKIRSGWMITKSSKPFDFTDSSGKCYDLHSFTVPATRRNFGDDGDFRVTKTSGYRVSSVCNFGRIPDYFHVCGEREWKSSSSCSKDRGDDDAPEKKREETVSLRDNTIIYYDSDYCVLENPWTIRVDGRSRGDRTKGLFSGEDLIQLRHCVCRRICA